MKKMKQLLYFLTLILYFSSCKKEEISPERPIKTYGKISFIDTTQSYAASLTTKSDLVEMDVLSAVVAPNGGVMETRIYAWNGKYGQDFRSISLVFTGTYDDFPAGNTYGVTVSYNRTSKVNLATATSQSSSPPVDLVFNYNNPSLVNWQNPDIKTASVPMVFSAIQLTSNSKKLVYSNPSLEVNGIFLQDFKLDISSFGGVNLPISNCMTFDLNGKSEGSFENQTTPCKQKMQPFGGPTIAIPGVEKVSGIFTDDSRNTLVSLEILFTHDDNLLAYNGPVGKRYLANGSDYTEINVIATDKNGKIYREQNNKGYVKAISEYVWQNVNFNLSPGHIVLQFEFDLIADDGSVISISNGNVFFRTTN